MMMSLKRSFGDPHRMTHVLQCLNYSTKKMGPNRFFVESSYPFSFKAGGSKPSTLIPGPSIPPNPYFDPCQMNSIQSPQKDKPDNCSSPLLFSLPSPGLSSNDNLSTHELSSPVLSTPSQELHARLQAKQKILLCAVPKRKTSVRRRRIRRAGHRLAKKKWNYVYYKLCPTCGDPVRPHLLCMNCHNKKDGMVPHFDPQGFPKNKVES